jgi:hypothetical protein
MKKLFLLITLPLLIMSKGFAQQTVVAKFIITDARMNGKDITPASTAANQYLIFYTLPNDTSMYFANVLSKVGSQSYGITYDIHVYTTPATATDYETDHFTFKWSYANSYDQHKGTATVRLLKIGKPNGVAFEMTVISENLDVLEYKGYMEGTLNLHISN